MSCLEDGVPVEEGLSLQMEDQLQKNPAQKTFLVDQEDQSSAGPQSHAPQTLSCSTYFHQAGAHHVVGSSLQDHPVQVGELEYLR